MEDAASAARLKVAAALTPELADAPHSAAQRFHLDAPGWWQPPTTPEELPAIADAVWDDRCLAVRYRRRDGEVERTLEPYGLVLKAGVWYLVARAGDDHRVYRVDRFVSVVPLDQGFTRDEGFDLPGFWEERSAAFARSILRESVVLRLTEAGTRALRYVTDRAAAEEALARGETDGQGRTTVTLPVESWDVAYTQLLSLGPECEVLGPPELRERMAEAAERTAALYR